jgi:hypothetical protein
MLGPRRQNAGGEASGNNIHELAASAGIPTISTARLSAGFGRIKKIGHGFLGSNGQLVANASELR